MMLRTLSASSGSKYRRVRGVEVGRHGLRVGVDHHRAPALAAEDVGRLDGAVVELDPLPDPDRAAADDERGGAGDGRRLGRRAGGRVGRVEVRRLGRELRGAGVDHRVARREAERRPGLADGRLRHAGQPAEVAVGERRPAWPSRAARAPSASPASIRRRARPPARRARGRRCGPSRRGTRARSRSPRG